MRENLFRDLNPGRHEERWPNDGVKPKDVFGQKGQIRRPPLLDTRQVVRVTDSRQVIHERIHPDISGLRAVQGEGNPPSQSRSGDADVVHLLLQLPNDLVASFAWENLKVVRML